MVCGSALAFVGLAGALANTDVMLALPFYENSVTGIYPLVQVLQDALEQLQDEQAASTGTKVFWGGKRLVGGVGRVKRAGAHSEHGVD